MSCEPVDEQDGEANNQTFVVNLHGCSAKKFLAQILETLKRHQHIVKDAAIAMEKEHGDLEVAIGPCLPSSPGQRSGTFLIPLLDYAKYQDEVLVNDEALACIRRQGTTHLDRDAPRFKSIDAELFQTSHTPCTERKYRSSWHMWDEAWHLMDELMSFVMFPKDGPYTPLANKELFQRLAWYAKERFGTVTKQTLYRAAWNILLGHIKGLLIDIALFAKLRIVYNLYVPRLHLREAGTRNIRALIENLYLDLNRYFQLNDYYLDGYEGQSVLVKRARCPSDYCKEGSPTGMKTTVPLSSLNIVIPDSSYLDSLIRRVITPLNLTTDSTSTQLNGLALKIYNMIRRHGLSHTSELLKENPHVSRSTVYRVINQLLSTNMIRRVEHGLYDTTIEEEEDEPQYEHKQARHQKNPNGRYDPIDDDFGDALTTVYSELQILLLGITTEQAS